MNISKQVYESLRQNEEKYRSLIETMNEGLLQVDNEGVIQFMNDQFCTMVGYSREELLGKPSFMLLANEDDVKILKDKIRIRTKGISDQYEIQIKKKSGEIIWTHVSGAPVFDADGDVTGSMGIHADVTERKLVEGALRESEEKFSKAFHNSPDAVIISQLDDGALLEVNESFVKITGYSEKEVVGKKYQELNLWHNFKEREKCISELKKKGEVQNFEVQFLKKDGSLSPALLSSSLIELDGIPCVITVARDVSEMKKTEEIMNQRLAAMEASRDGIAIINEKQEYLFVNNAYSRIYGYESPDEMTKLSLKDHYKEGEYQRLESEFGPLLKREGYWSGESVAHRNNGEIFSQEISLSTIDGGGIICTARDITKRKESEEEKRKLEEQLYQAQKMDSIGRLAGGVAHDFNNILSIIMGHADMLRLQFNDATSNEGRASDVIFQNVKRASDLTRQLLSLHAGEDINRYP